MAIDHQYTGNVSVAGSATLASSTASTTTEAAEYGIVASAQSGGTGNIAINVYAGNINVTSSSTTITNPIYGIYAFNKGSGDISIIVANSSSTITSSGVGINAVNQAATIAASLQSSIIVTSYATINSGSVVTGTGSPAAGISRAILAEPPYRQRSRCPGYTETLSSTILATSPHLPGMAFVHIISVTVMSRSTTMLAP